MMIKAQIAFSFLCLVLHNCCHAQREPDLEFSEKEPLVSVAIFDGKDQITILHLQNTFIERSIPYQIHGSRIHELQVPKTFRKAAINAISHSADYDPVTVKIEELDGEDGIVRVAKDDSNTFSYQVGLALSELPAKPGNQKERILAAFKKMLVRQSPKFDVELCKVKRIKGHRRHYLSEDKRLRQGFELEVELCEEPDETVRYRIQVLENFDTVCLISKIRSRKKTNLNW